MEGVRSRTSTVKLRHQDGRCKVVHMNRVRLRNLRPVLTREAKDSDQFHNQAANWNAPTIDHFTLEDTEERYDSLPARPQRTRRPPDRYGFS